MPNPLAPTEGAGRRIPFIVDPDNPGVAYLQAGEGGIDMGAGRTDGAALYVLPPPADTATRSAVVADDADTLILAANVLRRGAIIYNDSTQVLLLALGTVAAALNDYTVQVAADGTYELPSRYTGEVRGIWQVASSVPDGSAYVTELTTEAWTGS
jgi:hypothetical protein